MEIISNKDFKCYETYNENWKNGGKTITLDGKPLIPAKDALLITSDIATNGDIIRAIFNPYKICEYEYSIHIYMTEEDFLKAEYQMNYDANWWNTPYTKEASTTHE